jgi:Domain of unknown function (DUF4340)
MRGLRSTILLAVALAGLGAYIYFVTWKQPADTGSGQEKVFAGLTTDNITSLTITAEDGSVTTLTKTNGSWKMTAPLDTGADPAAVTGVTSALGSAEITRVVDDTGANASQYGLSTPRLQVAFKTNDNASHQLLIGSVSPTGASLYAKRDDKPQIFLIPQYQETTFNKTTFDLRDKSLLAFDRAKIQSISVTADGKTADLAKKGEEQWRLTSPVDARADFGTVESVVSKLQTAEMKKVVTEKDPTPAELKEYGLDHPSIAATIKTDAAPITVEFGKQADADTTYVRDNTKTGVFTVENAVPDELKKAPEDYRRRDLFDFRAYNATKVELTRGDQTVTFERVKGTGDDAVDSWKRTSPGAAADADKSKVEALLAKIADLRADSFVASTSGTGLNKPVLVAHVTFNDGKDQERVQFGEAGGSVYAAVPGDAGAAKVDKTAFDGVTSALDELAK